VRLSPPRAAPILPPMRVVRALAVGAAFLAVCWAVGGWGLPSAERSAYYPPHASVEYARAGVAGLYVTGPAKSFHPEEASVLGALAGMRPAQRDFNPHNFDGPTLHLYAVGAGLALAQRLHWIPASRSADYYLERPEAAARLYRTGRMVSAAWAALLLVVLVLGSPSAGLGAALMLAATPLFLACAASLVPDMAGTCLATLAALAAAGARAPGRWKCLALGLLAGAAASARYSGGLMLIPVLWASAGPGQRRGERWGALVAAGVGAAAGFLAGTPYALLAPGEFLHGLRLALAPGGLPPGLRSEGLGSAWRQHLDSALLVGCGLPFTLFLAGILGCLVDLNARRRSLLLSLAVWVALMLASRANFARHSLLALPLAATLAAEGWWLLLQRGGAERGWPIRIALAVALLPQLAVGLAFVLVMRGPDTRLLAARAITAWPAATRVRLLQRPAFTTPPLDVTRYEVRVGPVDEDTLRVRAPQALVVSEFELRSLARLEARRPGLARVARTLLSPGDTLRAGSYAWVGQEIRRPAGLAGWSRATRGEPRELVMLHPTIYLWRRIR